MSKGRVFVFERQGLIVAPADLQFGDDPQRLKACTTSPGLQAFVLVVGTGTWDGTRFLCMTVLEFRFAFCLRSAEIKGVCHHAQSFCCF